MDDNENRKALFAGTPCFIDELKRQLAVAKDEYRGRYLKPERYWGAERFRVKSISSELQASPSDDSEHEMRLPVGFMGEGVLKLKTGIMTGLDQHLADESYRYAKAEILRVWPDIDTETLHTALMDVVPHVVKVVACIWHGDRVLMDLKYRYSEPQPLPGKPHILKRKVLPSNRIGFPNAVVLSHQDPEKVFEDLIDYPFMLSGKPYSFEHDSVWTVVLPDRPEVLLVRHTALHGRPRDYFQMWQEEGVYPNLFVPPHVLMLACEDKTELLKRVIDFTAIAYDKAARSLDKKLRVDKVCGECGKPTRVTTISFKPERMLNYDADLALDKVSVDTFEQSIGIVLSGS